MGLRLIWVGLRVYERDALDAAFSHEPLTDGGVLGDRAAQPRTDGDRIRLFFRRHADRIRAVGAAEAIWALQTLLRCCTCWRRVWTCVPAVQVCVW